jgi:hypothetical protein
MADSPQVTEQSGNTRRCRDGRVRGIGRPFLKGGTGNPYGKSLIRARVEELYAKMAGDFEPMTATDEVLLRQACFLLARAERVHRHADNDNAIRMSGEARRVLEGLRRRPLAPKEPSKSWSDIATQAQAEADVRRAQELAEDDDT